MKGTLSDLLTWRPGALAKGTLRMTTGMGLRSLVQAAVFLVIARALGVDSYGAFAAVLALAGACGGLAGFGTRSLLVRDTARSTSSFDVAWGSTLGAILLGSPLLFVGYLGLAWLVLPDAVPLGAIVCIGIAEVALSPLALAGMSAYHSHERLGRAARLVLAPVLFRLFAAFGLLPLMLILPAGSFLNAWAALYMAASLAAAAYALVLTRIELGHAAWPTWAGLRSRLAAGIPFALSVIALKLYTDIDKAMIAQLASLEAAGVYSAAYRLVEMAAIPVASLLVAATPTMFRRGKGGNVGGAADYSARIIPIPALYALAAGAALFAFAGYVPVLLGQGFAEAVLALRWLAWLPILSLARLFLQYLMIGGDRQKVAVGVLLGGAAANVLLNLALIPAWSWRGAVVSTYAAEILMASAMAWVVARNRRRNAN